MKNKDDLKEIHFDVEEIRKKAGQRTNYNKNNKKEIDNLKLYMGIVVYIMDDRDVILLVAKNKEEAKEKLEKWIYEEGCDYLDYYLNEINEVDGHKIKVE